MPGCGDIDDNAGTDTTGAETESTETEGSETQSTETSTETAGPTTTDTSDSETGTTDGSICTEPEPESMECGSCSCINGLWACDPCVDPPEIGDECSPGYPCGSDAYCDYPDDLCGDGVSGTCVAAPEGCDPGGDQYFCGCSGELELNECSLAIDESDVSIQEDCVSEELRACGALYCATDYPCVTYVPEEGEPTKECGGLTTACELDCDCLLEEHPECTECAVEDDRLVVSCEE